MPRKTMKQTTEPAIRRNWGYWDGFNARQRNAWPVWAPASSHRAAHPFDRPYGEAFWSGWYGEAHPATGLPPADHLAATYAEAREAADRVIAKIQAGNSRPKKGQP